MEVGNRKLLWTTILLSAGNFIPILLFCLLPKTAVSPVLYEWIGLICAATGLGFAVLLRNRVKIPFEELKRIALLKGFPDTGFRAILTRLAFTISYLGIRLNLFWIALVIVTKILSLSKGA